jgi:GSCFA family
VAKMDFSLKKLKESYPHLEVILTVSPIRHIKDGLIENQRSKATLLLAIDELQKNNDFLHYFPAYELLLDDLRDYRFYETDMIHPSQQAVDYIWEKFKMAFFSKETLSLLKPIEQVVNAAKHRPFYPTSLEYQKFIQHQKQEITRLETEHPYLNFSKEKEVFG